MSGALKPGFRSLVATVNLVVNVVGESRGFLESAWLSSLLPWKPVRQSYTQLILDIL